MDEIKKASEIEDCTGCPLYGADCKGGWTSGAGGTPIEPPCCSWNGDEEIYEGMYSEMDSRCGRRMVYCQELEKELEDTK